MKWALTIATIILLLNSSLFFIARADITFVSGSGFNLTFTTNQALLFQNDLTHNVTITVKNGAMNGSGGSINMNDGGGTFAFHSLNNTQITLNWTVDAVKYVINNLEVQVPNQQGNTTVTILANDNVVIFWDYAFAPFIPLMFLIGMSGLGCMFIGPLWAVMQIKRKKYEDGMVAGVIFTAIGIGLFAAWLTAGAI